MSGAVKRNDTILSVNGASVLKLQPQEVRNLIVGPVGSRLRDCTITAA